MVAPVGMVGYTFGRNSGTKMHWYRLQWFVNHWFKHSNLLICWQLFHNITVLTSASLAQSKSFNEKLQREQTFSDARSLQYVGLVIVMQFLVSNLLNKKPHHNSYKLLTLDDDLIRKNIDGMGSSTLRGGLSKLC